MSQGTRPVNVLDDVGDEAQVTAKKAKHKIDRDYEIKQLFDMLQGYGFRHFMWRVLSICNYGDKAPFEGIDRFEGRRDVGVELVEELWTADPQAFTIMMREADARGHGSIVAVSRDTVPTEGKK